MHAACRITSLGGERGQELKFVLLVLNSRPQSWSRGYKTFFMLNSAEREILSANKCENANNS